MPFDIQYPMVNGHRFSFASIEAQFNGTTQVGFKSINYGPKLELGEVWGSAPQKLGRTRGKQNATCDFEMLRLEFENLKDSLAGGGDGYGEQAFDIIVQHAEENQPVITDSILGFRIVEPNASHTDGTDASMVKVTGNPMDVLLNGVSIVKATKNVGAI